MSQFNIETSTMPQFLVSDVPTNKYYQNKTITDIREFDEGTKDGTIAEDICEEFKVRGFPTIEVNRDGVFLCAGILESLHGFTSRNMPYTLVGAVVVFCGILYCALQTEILKLQLERAKKENMKKKAVKED